MAYDSKRELIIADVVATLRAVDEANGYNHTLQIENVHRRWIDISEVSAAATPLLGVGVGDEVGKAKVFAGATGELKYNNNLTLFIWGWVYNDKHDDLQTDVERLLRDVKKALMNDKQRSSNAVCTYFERAETDEGTLAVSGYGVFEAEFRIEYQYTELSP